RRGGRDVAAFLAETCPSVGGQLMLPAGYLAAAYQAVRAAGAVCIADEVQTGLGRIGSHTWAFEAHGVVPDIVVMGKPLGNGHPLAAVGSAVLDVLRDEALQAHAARVGDGLLADLRSLATRHAWIGDVRGAGLF